MASLSMLFEEHVRDLYYAERKVAQTLPKMAKKCQSQELRAAFEKHLEETEAQTP